MSDPPSPSPLVATTEPEIQDPADGLLVLSILPTAVELGWRGGGEMRYASRAVEDQDPGSLAAAARELLDSVRTRRSPRLLCLGSDFFDSRQVLLVDMPDEEASAVLARRSANHLGVALDDSLFWAQSRDSVQQTWLVHSRRRSEHLALLTALRGVGINVRRTVVACDVITRSMARFDDDEGRILLSTTGRTIHAHLFRGGELVQESRIKLVSYEERAATYASVVQDVRQLASFWSKASRGSRLVGVHMFGFSRGEADELRTPLGIATQGAEVTVIGGSDSDRYVETRKQLLELLMEIGPSALNLSLRLPPRRSVVMAFGIGLLVLAGGLVREIGGLLDARIEERHEELRSWTVSTEQLADNEVACASYVVASGSLDACIASLEATRYQGLPLAAAIERVVVRLRDDVELKHVSFQDSELGTDVVVEGSILSEVGVAARRLDAIRRELYADPEFINISIHPSARVPDTELGEALGFTLTASFLRRRG